MVIEFIEACDGVGIWRKPNKEICSIDIKRYKDIPEHIFFLVRSDGFVFTLNIENRLSPEDKNQHRS